MGRTTDEVLAAIDAAVADVEVSADAVRSRPPPSDVERMKVAGRGLLQALGQAGRKLLP